MARHRYRGSVQLHISGRDLLALQQYHDAQVAQIRAAAAAKHASVMANLSPGALKLHTHFYGGLAIGIYVLSLIVTFASGGNIPVVVVPWAILAILDWHNFITLHGIISWRLWWLEHRGWVIAGFIFGYWVLLFTPIIYLIQCITRADEIREWQRQKLQARIAELERQVLPQPTQPAE